MTPNTDATLNAFLKTAWSDHGDRAQDVADRLAASLDLVHTPDDVAPFARLLTHVYGEHLGLWSRGVDLLASMRARTGSDAVGAAARSIDVGIATLRYGDGDAAALDALPADDRIAALANASSALAARNDVPRAIVAFERALETAQGTSTLGTPAMRSLAAGGNNLAVALEGRSDRSPTESSAMLSAAEAALLYWKQVGTWLEEERAEYRLARSRLQAGEASAATRSAARCVALCDGNDAPPFEQFFAHSVLACAHRAAGDGAAFETHRQAALRYLGHLSDDERPWCENERKELDCDRSLKAPT